MCIRGGCRIFERGSNLSTKRGGGEGVGPRTPPPDPLLCMCVSRPVLVRRYVILTTDERGTPLGLCNTVYREMPLIINLLYWRGIQAEMVAGP